MKQGHCCQGLETCIANMHALSYVLAAEFLNEAADMRAIGASWDKKPELRFML